MGSVKTDHTMLKSGLIQKANGGYIIFQAKDLTDEYCILNIPQEYEGPFN